MSNTPNPFNTMMEFGKMVPGFDFLKGLVDNSDQALPRVGQWVAPTMDADELDKRIRDLKAVQFWLEQNTHMVAATVQALEVQKMTLGALRTMNVSLADLAEAMKVPTATPSPSPKQAPTPTTSKPEAPKPAPSKAAAPIQPSPRAQKAEAAAKALGPEPLQWWSALTEQFGQIAASTLTPQAAPASRPAKKVSSTAKKASPAAPSRPTTVAKKKTAR